MRKLKREVVSWLGKITKSLFIFLLFFFLLDLLHRRECGKVSYYKCHKCHGHMIGSHKVVSHDEYGKTVHRLCEGDWTQDSRRILS